jgi:CheY-like chemotaxis protein
MARILVAEDDMAMRMIAGVLLEQLGHQPVLASDGQQALEILQKDPGFDLLLTDVMMPRMDGRQLILRAHTLEPYREMPVIVMSAAVGPREIWDLLERGATCFQPKPLNLVNLKENIELVMPKKN